MPIVTRRDSHRFFRTTLLAAALFAVLTAVPAAAQWRNLPNEVPLGPDGKPNLSAPAPRTSTGRVDLSGVQGVPKINMPNTE